MLEWTLRVLRLCREMRDLSSGALSAFEEKNDLAAAVVKGQMLRAVEGLIRELPTDFPPSRIGDLRRHVGFGDEQDYRDILRLDLPNLEAKIDAYAGRGIIPERTLGFEALLHPIVREAAIRHYHAGDYRNAVLDAITVVFDKIRERTNIDHDGDRLINQVFSVENPVLILSEVETSSGKSDQSGFADIFRGFYRGVRNPKAHSLVHDLDAVKAGQHLVLASILMRRVIEARPPN